MKWNEDAMEKVESHKIGKDVDDDGYEFVITYLKQEWINNPKARLARGGIIIISK